MLKLILFALASFKMKNSTSSLESAALLLKKNILNELLALSFRILAGIILVATVIISISHLEKLSGAFFEQFRNGLFFEVFSFASIAIAGSFGLYWLFRKNVSVPAPEIRSAPESDLQRLLIQFAEGFIRGMDKPNPPRPAAHNKDQQ